MYKIVGISFNQKGRIYNFDAKDYDLKINDEVIVETEKGLQYGFVLTNIKEVIEQDYDFVLKPIIRRATSSDRKVYEKNRNDSERALIKAKEIVSELGLAMRLLDAHYTFDRKQLLFNFIADERIDFRELAKRLAQIYKTRIELRQIGIRDKAREIGGIGPCGRLLCCNSFLNDINSVTINMAKNQLLALNPVKINGVCGRLLCCLAYEDSTYNELRKELPEIGELYKVNNVEGKVVAVDVFTKKIRVEDRDKNSYEVIIEDGRDK